MQKPVGLKSALSVSITRANGRVINIGVIKGGHWWQRVIPLIRLWFHNRQSRRGGK